MSSPRNMLVALCLLSAAVVIVSASVSEQLLRVPLFEVGGLWVKAITDVLSSIAGLVANPSQIDLTSPWLYICTGITCIAAYFLYKLLFTPLNRVRYLGDTGYITDGRQSMKDVANAVMKRRKVGDIPPVYPNGWFNVLESRDLEPRQSKSVSVLGQTLAVFRDDKGQAHVLDAYCPHLGANLAIGGRVFGNCLECPFHGWKFRGDDGKCVHIPYIDNNEKIPEKAKVKSWPVVEMNGFIYIWFHAEQIDPTWMPQEIEDISKGQWTYRGRTEHIVNSHIEEVPENGGDPGHLAIVHGPFIGSGTDLRYTYSRIWEFGKHIWTGTWEAVPDQKHVGHLTLTHSMSIFGIRMPILDLNVDAYQIGPGIVHLYFNSVFGKGCFLQALTPVEPMKQRMIHTIYGSKWTMPTIVAKFFMLAEAIQVERDIMIWNNKQFQSKPLLVKSNEDSTIGRHRRWYSQFYSENSPRLTFQKDTLEW